MDRIRVMMSLILIYLPSIKILKEEPLSDPSGMMISVWRSLNQNTTTGTLKETASWPRRISIRSLQLMTWKLTGILKRLLKSSLELTIIHNLINNSLISMPLEFQMELRRCWNKLRGKLLRKLNPSGKTKSSSWEDSTKKLGLITKRRNLELDWRKNLLDSRDCLVLQGKIKELRKQQLFIPNNLARLPWDLITLSRNKSSSMLSMRIISKLLEIRLWATNSWTKTKPSSKEKFKDLNKKMDIHTMSNLMVTFKDMVLDKDIQLARSVNSVRGMVEAIQPILNSLIL